MLAEIRNELRTIDPDVPIANLRTMSDVVAGALLPQRIGVLLLVMAGGLGMFLSMMGQRLLFGVDPMGATCVWLVSRHKRTGRQSCTVLQRSSNPLSPCVCAP